MTHLARHRFSGPFLVGRPPEQPDPAHAGRQLTELIAAQVRRDPRLMEFQTGRVSVTASSDNDATRASLGTIQRRDSHSRYPDWYVPDTREVGLTETRIRGI